MTDCTCTDCEQLMDYQIGHYVQLLSCSHVQLFSCSQLFLLTFVLRVISLVTKTATGFEMAGRVNRQSVSPSVSPSVKQQFIETDA